MPILKTLGDNKELYAAQRQQARERMMDMYEARKAMRTVMRPSTTMTNLLLPRHAMQQPQMPLDEIIRRNNATREEEQRRRADMQMQREMERGAVERYAMPSQEINIPSADPYDMSENDYYGAGRWKPSAAVMGQALRWKDNYMLMKVGSV